MPTKVKLSDIRSLTLYAGEKTEARRSSPVQQLKCIGKPCRGYQPDVVRCTNTGGSGVEVDWKCEADLPTSLRMGRVEVGCEGWSRPGDPYVLKGSCGLEYHLLEVPKAFRDDKQDSFRSSSMPMTGYLNKFFDFVFVFLFIGVALFLAFQIIKSCLSAPQRSPRAARPRGGGGGGGGAGGWFTGGANHRAPPPPYSQDPPTSSNNAAGWRPGFWTGLGAGGLLGRYFQPTPHDPYRAERERMMRPSTWDWERPTTNRGWFDAAPSRAQTAARPQDSPRANNWFGTESHQQEDRGEGSSTGATRRSTGYGSSRVR
ncbi:DUF1183-domain-containing protein [Auriculariales sp. MPI-PUGE-AT-0066]|nr:DUF1183-domain-containing protein [Auriculariales sp. MPI-PUGE-AT-0066]